MEIRTEMKKMTLAHEIGAGASCLKCKDKCEGFELHFWRKICRNCKCGLEDHDVQMESAENKKVGRLFQDTKYTGLIAKLKSGPYSADVSHQPSSSPNVSHQPSSSANVSHQTLSSSKVSHKAPSSANASQHAPSSDNASQQAVSPANASQQAPFSANVSQQASSFANVSQQAPSSANVSHQARSQNAGPRPETAKTVTLEWTPPVTNKHLVMRYIELLPPERRPVTGTVGAEYRKRQMARQLPEHDQEPSCCHDLSPGEVKVMQQYVKKCKTEALGVGDLKLPEEMAGEATRSEGKEASCPGTDTQNAKGPAGGPEQGSKGTIGKAGSAGGTKNADTGRRNYLCYQCNQPMKEGEPAVYADRAGYERLWHPACFVCCTCTELLVDMIYFWKKDKLYCGRHYGESEKPRCGGCDELIFSNEYTQAEGQNWHLKHFCCFDCDCVLADMTYVMEDIHPVCESCYMKNHAVKCVACDRPIEPQAQRVSVGDSHWHAEPQCFQCSGCAKCLIGQRFMVVKNKIFCSVECKKSHQ